MKISLVVLVNLAALVYCAQAISSGCRGSFYDDQALVEDKVRFSIYDRIFCRITCQDIADGEHTISITWVNPGNEVIRQDSQVIQTEASRSPLILFWIKLFRKGPVERSFSATDFAPEHYGTWTVYLYLDGKEVSAQQIYVY